MSSEKVKFSFIQIKEDVVELTLTEFLELMKGYEGEESLTAEQYKNYTALFVKLLKRKDSKVKLREDKTPSYTDEYTFEDDNNWIDDVAEWAQSQASKPKTVAKQVKKCVKEQTEEQYNCDLQNSCKGGPFPRDQVYYDPVGKASVCKKCWGGAELPPGCS